jgi:hypothetical protein
MLDEHDGKLEEALDAILNQSEGAKDVKQDDEAGASMDAAAPSFSKQKCWPNTHIARAYCSRNMKVLCEHEYDMDKAKTAVLGEQGKMLLNNLQSVFDKKELPRISWEQMLEDSNASLYLIFFSEEIFSSLINEVSKGPTGATRSARATRCAGTTKSIGSSKKVEESASFYWLKRVAMKNKALGFENTKEEGNQFFPLSIEVGSHVAIKAKACQNFVVHFEFLLYSYYLYVSRYLY